MFTLSPSHEIPSISEHRIQMCTHVLKCFNFKHLISSSKKLSHNPVFFNFACTVLHHDCDPGQPQCREPKARLNHLLPFSSSLPLCLKTPGVIPKPKGAIRQSSNLENHHPSATHARVHTRACVCSLLVVIFLGGAWPGWRVVFPNYIKIRFNLTKSVGCCLRPCVPLSVVIYTHTHTHSIRPDQVVKRFLSVLGSIPSLMKLHGQ